MQSINPATGKVTREWAEHSDAEVEQTLTDLSDASTAWASAGVGRRAAVLSALAEALRRHQEEHAALMTAEMGKPIREARAEVEKCAWVCEYYAENAQDFLASELVETDATLSRVEFVPLGMVLGIMPWNFPYWQVFRFIAPALAAGNVCLLKHASNVCGCSAAIERLVEEAAVAEGWDEPSPFRSLRLASGRVADLIADPAIHAVTLTGSEKAGRSVAEAAGAALKKTVLELGGSDPCIVTADADLELAAEVGAQSRAINTGQSCIAAKRFLVEESVAEEFEGSLIERLSDLKVGDPTQDDTDLGPLARKEFVDDLADQVERSVAQGAKVVLKGGPKKGRGFYFRPVVLAEVTPEMPVFAEETFGPVAPVIRVGDLEQAVELANATRYGLGAAVWTGDPERDAEAIGGLQAGALFVNGLVKSDPRLPFGGVKASGYGRELSAFGIREFVNVRTYWRA